MREFRKSQSKVVWGVCGGIAEYFDIDPIIVRAIFVAGLLCSFGAFLLLYAILALITPD